MLETKNRMPVRDKERFLVFGSPLIEDDVIAEVVASMRSGWLSTGPKVHQFEEMFRAYKGCRYAVALNSCTAAIHLALLALDVGPGDEVITTAMTFCATVNAIIHSGATPVLVDCEQGSMNIDPVRIEKSITKKTKAILVVHFAGRPCEMDAIERIAREHNLRIIEDCAHAIETEYKGRKVGTIGDLGCFSFYVTKNIVTGEGGMVVTNHEEYSRKVRVLGLHGMTKDAWKRFSDDGYHHYEVVECGFKYNMMDLQAAMGIRQLGHVESYRRRRQNIWEIYNKAFADLPIGLPLAPQENTRHAYHLYTILIDERRTGINRDQFLEAMTKENIGIGVHYLSIPEHPFYRKTFGWKPEAFPYAQRIGRQTVSLQISPKMTLADAEDVICAVRKVLAVGFPVGDGGGRHG